jgi:hypothetical protein
VGSSSRWGIAWIRSPGRTPSPTCFRPG